jgi:poly(3-hydroxybutyrate) depolymerase
MGGAIDTRQAASCRPNRVPALLIARSDNDQSAPFGGGRQPSLPGNGVGGDVLSAASTRGLWAALARCSDGQPSVAWLPSNRGRLALETHTQCRAGGPVSMLSAIEGAELPANEDLTLLISNFLSGKG